MNRHLGNRLADKRCRCRHGHGIVGITRIEVVFSGSADHAGTAAFIAVIAPAAMVFVPCKDGKSHTPEEWAEPHDLAAGTAFIAGAVRRFDGQTATPPD